MQPNDGRSSSERIACMSHMVLVAFASQRFQGETNRLLLAASISARTVDLLVPLTLSCLFVVFEILSF